MTASERGTLLDRCQSLADYTDENCCISNTADLADSSELYAGEEEADDDQDGRLQIHRLVHF